MRRWRTLSICALHVAPRVAVQSREKLHVWLLNCVVQGAAPSRILQAAISPCLQQDLDDRHMQVLGCQVQGGEPLHAGSIDLGPSLQAHRCSLRALCHVPGGFCFEQLQQRDLCKAQG